MPKRDPLLLGAVAALSTLALAVAALASFYPHAQGATTPTAQPKAAGLNTPVPDGKLEYTVTRVSCGSRTLISGPIMRRARGEYCLVRLTVKNLGTEAQTFGDGSPTAWDVKNIAHANDESAESPVNVDVQAFLEPIGPGSTARGTLVFDVPIGTKLAAVELRDSFLSAGVKVRLR
ncbi:DUF4352 domain-containing protein [Actinoplanes sp. CA-142083]|uniref:DUF4352 domain-containing protein n=1 Tax=Actinoplanes sp. CA-142083 TaxID=3239903 RepID=UPI003D8EC98B